MQALARHFGSEVRTASAHGEFGPATIRIAPGEGLLSGLSDNAELSVWMSHADRVEQLPDGFVSIASTESAPCAAIADDKRHYYGLQFHPEVSHTECGEEILRRFVVDICGCATDWNAENIIDDQVEAIRQRVGEDRVLLGLSGGVDSAVAALLLHRAIGDQLVCVFVDNGLLRLGEADEVMAVFANHFGIRVVRADADQRFFAVLAGVHDPKRSARPSARPLSRSLRHRRAALAMCAGWRRAPSTRMSSNPPVPGLARRRSSSRTTMSAGFPSACGCSSWSHCANCSKTR